MTRPPDGWVAVSCVAADMIRTSPHVVPMSSKTDPSGVHGSPEIFTEWGTRKTEIPVLREHRWPAASGGEDVAPCEHFVPGREAAR